MARHDDFRRPPRAMLAALALWVCSAPIALPQTGGGTATQTFLFDADALTFRLGNIRAADVPKLGAPFGPPEDATYVSVVSADAPSYSRVWISMDDGNVENRLEFDVYPSPADAEQAFSSALATPESRLGAGAFSILKKTVTKYDDQSGQKTDYTCASKPLREGSVKQVRCALRPSDGQVVIIAYSYGREVKNDQELMGLMAKVADGVKAGQQIPQRVQAVLIERGGAVAWPKGGWQLDPKALSQRLLAAGFGDSANLPKSFGAPGAGKFEYATLADESKGLYGKVIVPMDADGRQSGLEFWVFETAAARVDKDMQFPLLAPPEARADGTVSTSSNSYTTTQPGAPAQTLLHVRCARREKKRGIAHQIRCTYDRPGSQVVIVAYVYGTKIADDDAWEELSSTCADAIRAGLVRLAAAEAPLIAALRRPGSVMPTPGTVPGPTAGMLDPAVVGTWRTYVPVGQALARLQLVINGDGSYSFSSDNPVFGPHSGRFTAAGGNWSLSSPTWQDSGTYQLPDANTMILRGKLGPGAWSRVH
jgi:hypothetical protein